MECVYLRFAQGKVPEGLGAVLDKLSEKGIKIERKGCPKDGLCLTDLPMEAEKLAGAGLPVVGCLHPGNRGVSFGGIKYVLELCEESTEEESAGLADYLIRVWQRYVGQPWQIVETERCAVRETVPEDLEYFYEIYSEPSVALYMEDLDADPQQEQAKLQAYREQMYGFYEFGMWTVVLKETGRVIGRVGFSLETEGDGIGAIVLQGAPWLGYVIGKPWQGKGLALEVCKAILAYARDALEMDLAAARVQAENTRSIRLLKKLGFQVASTEDQGVPEEQALLLVKDLCNG